MMFIMLLASNCAGCGKPMKHGTDHLCHECYLKSLGGQASTSEGSQTAAENSVQSDTLEKPGTAENELLAEDSEGSDAVAEDTNA